MPKKAVKAFKKATRKPAARKPAQQAEEVYHVTLREAGGTSVTATVLDSVLYPIAVSWNQLLASMKDPKQSEKLKKAWRQGATKTVHDLATKAKLADAETDAFIKAAASSGMVQVEMEWESDHIGYAARVFPWEALIALATKETREQLGKEKIAVVRRLVCKSTARPKATGKPKFLVTANVVDEQLFDYHSECNAVGAALGANLEPRPVSSVEAIAKETADQPAIVHFVLPSVARGVRFETPDDSEGFGESDTRHSAEVRAEQEGVAVRNEDVARAIASHGPDLAVFSSCYTGRRLAPHAIVAGAKLAIGFQSEVTDAILPLFFGAFYRAWKDGHGALRSLSSAIEVVKDQDGSDDLGTVTLWSADDLLAEAVREPTAARASMAMKGTPKQGPLNREELIDSLSVMCTPEATLNYSILHNSRGGLFKEFVVTKIKPGPVKPLEVTVSIDTGVDRPASSTYYVELPEETSRRVNLADLAMLPLGAQLLRQRGEIVHGTLTVSVSSGGIQFYHKLDRIDILPCDEWRDKRNSGRHFLPSFIFPRDPAVRTILSHAQPFLRALTDQAVAGFDGYQSGDSGPDAGQGVELQARAIWAALQHPLRLDYTNPPPTYTSQSQRLRTPEEMLRARRGTCIELALLLAACWEHIGIQPVVFLIRGHAFAGYWASMQAHDNFINNLEVWMAHANEEAAIQQQSKHARGTGDGDYDNYFGGKITKPKDAEAPVPWMLDQPFHLRAICDQVANSLLIPIEATYIPLQESFRNAIKESRELLYKLNADEFDGMLDVQTARESGITPLAIITDGPAA